MDQALRPMSTSQVLDRTFGLYRNNFLLFAGIAAVPPALLMIGQFCLLASGRVSGGPAGRQALEIAAIIGTVLIGIALIVLWIIGYALATGASVYAVSRVHLGYPATIAESYRLMRPYAGRVLWLVTLIFLIVGAVILVATLLVAVPIIVVVVKKQPVASGMTAGLALIFVFVVPAAIVLAFYLSAKLSLAVPACVIERLPAVDSLKRSWDLTKGSVLRLILVNFLAAIISFAIGAVLSIPYIVGIALFVKKKDPNALLPFVMWQYVADFLARSVAFPIATIAVSLIYYDERVRKEAFDLQLMMEAIGQAQQAPVLSEPSRSAPAIG